MKGSSGCPLQGCLSKATNGHDRPAREKVEIRGWVVDLDLRGHLDEDEMALAVLLDWGWIPASPADNDANPLNDAEGVARAITPYNLIWFGNGDAAGTFTLPGLGPAGSGSARISTPTGQAWGGSRAGVIHVEVNGWGPARMTSPAPADWIRLPNIPRVGWPFDPGNPPTLHRGPLQLGDYVRLVGTLWEDEPHVTTGSDEVKDAKRCWNDFPPPARWGRGHTELHPVDFMAVIDRVPQPDQPERLHFVSICGAGTVTQFIPPPPGPRPSPTSSVEVVEFVDDDFTERDAVITLDRFQVRPDGVTVVTVQVEGQFKAAYHVFWR